MKKIVSITMLMSLILNASLPVAMASENPALDRIVQSIEAVGGGAALVTSTIVTAIIAPVGRIFGENVFMMAAVMPGSAVYFLTFVPFQVISCPFRMAGGKNHRRYY